MHGKKHSSDYEGDGPEVIVDIPTSNADNRRVGDRVTWLDDGQAGCLGRAVTGTVISVQRCIRSADAPHAANRGIVRLRTDADELTPGEETELIVASYEQAAAQAAVWATLTEGHEDRSLVAAIAAGEEMVKEEMMKLELMWADEQALECKLYRLQKSVERRQRYRVMILAEFERGLKRKLDMPRESARAPKKIDAVSLMMRNTTKLGSNFPSKVHGRQGSLGSFQLPPPECRWEDQPNATWQAGL